MKGSAEPFNASLGFAFTWLNNNNDYFFVPLVSPSAAFPNMN